MTFLNPSVLYFLPLLAVPIIIHLLNLYKPKKVYFPRVDLLEKIAETTATRFKVKNWLLLLVRVLFVGFLILAFSQPYFPNSHSTNKEGSVLLYIDNSPSMFVQENGYQPFSVATDVSLKILNGLSSSQKVYILTNEFSSIDKIPLSKKQAKDRLSNLKVNVNSRTVESVLNRIELLFENEELSKQFFVADFQNQTKENFIDMNENVVLVPVDQGDYSNIVVDSVWFDSPAMISSKNVKLNIRVKGWNITNDLNTGVEVSISNEIIASQQIIWSGKENQKVLEIDFDLGKPGLYSAEVKIDDVPMNFDNNFSFVFEVLNEVNVTILSNKVNTPLSKVYVNEPLFNIALYKDGELDQKHVKNSNLLIVEGLSLVMNNLDLINDKLEQRATVLLIPDENDKDYSILSNYFKVSESDSIRRELNVNGNHSYFSGVLMNAKENLVRPWYNTKFKVEENLSFVLYDKFKKGGIGFKKHSNGNVGLIPFPLNEKSTNLHRHAFFVPLMYEIAFHSSGKEKRLFYRVKNNLVNLPLKDKADVVELTDEVEVFVAQKRNELYQLSSKMHSGIYYLNNEDSNPVLAMNHELNESNVNFMPNVDFDDLKVEVLKVGDDLKLQQYFKNLSLGFSLWKYCLILSILFLIVEIALIRFLR